MNANKYIAEFVGTFALALAVGVSLGNKIPVPTPVIAALTLGVCVYTFGAISGTHINPAITIGLASIGKISGKDAIFYLAAQIAGGALALLMHGVILGVYPPVNVVDTPGVFAGEALGAFWLAIGVSSVVFGKSPGAAGLTIGGSLLLGISLAAPLSNAALNPAVALGIGSLSLVYVLGPIAGAVAAMQLYKLIGGESKKDH
jgi:aquaporin Z